MITANLKCECPCVYSINGALHEDGQVELDENCVYYVTVLPLDAIYLPYTVKLVGTKVQTNKDLCVSVSTKHKKYLVFAKRYNYVYSPHRYEENDCKATVFFTLVKQGDYKQARAKLTPSLSSSVSDEDLAKFFDGYEYVVRADKDSWVLADNNGQGEIFRFVEKDGLIDDIFTQN